MLEMPKVDIAEANNDIYKIIELCEIALINKGKELNMEKEYQSTHDAMMNQIGESRSLIRTISILTSFCVLYRNKNKII
jgi:hypothetical protein